MDDEEIMEDIRKLFEDKYSLAYEDCYFITKKLNIEYWDLISQEEEDYDESDYDEEYDEEETQEEDEDDQENQDSEDDERKENTDAIKKQKTSIKRSRIPIKKDE